MRKFTTSKGLELPLMNLKGKDYLQVAYRIQWFRSEHPHGKIDTERISENDKHVTYRATISVLIDSSEKPGTGYCIKLSNADKTLLIKSTLDYEKCETGAIGRALALAGYGTQFAEDIDEGDDLSDAPLGTESPSQAASMMDRGGGINQEAKVKFTIGKYAGKTFDEVFFFDSKEDFSYTKWIDKIKKADPSKVHKDQLQFLSYAIGKGFTG